MRRRFLVMGHTQTTDPRCSLDDLAGACGRLDVLARAVTSALCLSHGLREDTEVWTVIDHDDVQDGPRTVVWHGDRLRNLNPDERSTAALFRKAFAHDAIEVLEEVHPGLEVAEMGLQQALAGVAAQGPLILLDRDGDDLRAAPLTGPATYLLSDHRAWTPADEAMLRALEPPRYSVAGRWLHGHQTITLVHDVLDRAAAAPQATT